MQSNDRFTSAEGSRGTVVLCSAISIPTLLILSIIWMRLWWTIESGHYDRATLLREIGHVLTMLAMGWIIFALLSLVQYIALAVWMYAMNSNLPTLQYQPKMTPLLAALVMFLPFLNFVLSPYALLDIWWGSDPGRLPQPNIRRSPPNSIWLWSLLLPATSVLGSVAGQSLPEPNNIHAFSALATWGLIYFGVAILSNVVLILLVREITKMQETRYEQLHPAQSMSKLPVATLAEATPS